jgi:pimeloyl-ACP methyl ester carboxylesterase
VNRESAKIQCVVARGGLFDFIGATRTPAIMALGGQFLGMGFVSTLPPFSLEYQTHRAASPITHVTPAAAPHLLLHGDADTTFPIDHAERMHEALERAGVPVKLVRIAGGGHGPDFPGAVNPPDYLGEMIHWFDAHLPVGAGVPVAGDG